MKASIFVRTVESKSNVALPTPTDKRRGEYVKNTDTEICIDYFPFDYNIIMLKTSFKDKTLSQGAVGRASE